MKLKLFNRGSKSQPSELNALTLQSEEQIIAPPSPHESISTPPIQEYPQIQPPAGPYLPNNSRGARTSLNYRPSFHQDNHYHPCCRHCHQSDLSPVRERGATAAGAEGASNRVADIAVKDTAGIQSLFHAGGSMIIRVAEAYMMSYLTQGEMGRGLQAPPGTVDELKSEDGDDEERRSVVGESARMGVNSAAV